MVMLVVFVVAYLDWGISRNNNMNKDKMFAIYERIIG
jgi:hypothetical protein